MTRKNEELENVSGARLCLKDQPQQKRNAAADAPHTAALFW